MFTSNGFGLAAVALFVSGSLAGPLRPVVESVVRQTDQASNTLSVTPNHVPMRRVSVKPDPNGARPDRHIAADPHKPTLLRNIRDVYYIVDIQVGNQTIPVSVDTGSSDTWFIQQPFKCVDFFYETVPEEKCGFGPGFQGNFSGGKVENRTFSRAYADGTFVSGTFGFDDVAIGGVDAKHTQLAMVNYTYWYGDGLTAGLLGLAYPLMTGIDGYVEEYDPVFTTMWKNNNTSPLFSMALSREHENGSSTTPDESYLAFGGLPPVEYDDSTWARVPILSMDKLPEWGVEKPNLHGLYAISADAYVYGKAATPDSPANLTANSTQFPILIDAGSTLTQLPVDLADAVYNSFDPPANYSYPDGAWYAPCNATVPDFGVKLGSQTFYISPEDLLRQNVRDQDTGTRCRVGIMDSDFGPHVLGVTFLTNVVAVFDVGNNEMRFAARKKYY